MMETQLDPSIRKNFQVVLFFFSFFTDYTESFFDHAFYSITESRKTQIFTCYKNVKSNVNRAWLKMQLYLIIILRPKWSICQKRLSVKPPV